MSATKNTRQVYACRVFLYTGIFKCCSKTISEDNGLDFFVNCAADIVRGKKIEETIQTVAVKGCDML